MEKTCATLARFAGKGASGILDEGCDVAIVDMGAFAENTTLADVY